MNKNTYENEMSVLSTYIKEVEKVPLISREEEFNLAMAAKNGDMKAREKLICANSRFVISVAKKFQGRGLPLEDLISEGNIGLIVAIDKFEPEKGFHFISYAIWWIRQSILKALADKTRMVRLPMNKNAEYVQIQNAKNKLEEDGDVASVEDIAVECSMTPDQVNEILSYSKDVISLDSPVGDEDGASLGDFIESDHDNPEEMSIEKALKEQFNRILNQFPERERNIIIKRYGLEYHKPLSLKEVGDLYGLTKERIRQIEKKVLTQLSQSQEVQDMRAYTA